MTWKSKNPAMTGPTSLSFAVGYLTGWVISLLILLLANTAQEKSQTWKCWQESQNVRRCRLVAGQP